MVSLTADDKVLLKEVRSFIEPVEVFDPAGKLLGLFVPTNLEGDKERYERAAARIDWGEIERRCLTEEKGVTLQTFWARVRLLEAEMKRRKECGEMDLSQEEAMAFLQSLAEIQRRKELNEPGLKTSEVFERLKSITPDEKMKAFLQEKIDRLVERDQCAAP